MEPELLELSAKARDEDKKYPKKRFIYSKITQFLPEPPSLALIGPRGTGKTVILKQLLSERESSFYLSLDTQKPAGGLFSFAKEAEEKGIRLLLLDEVHTYPNFEMELKKIHDFLDLKLVFTSSSSLSLHESAYDLSRRVRSIQIAPFSFREFLFFEKEELLPAISFGDLIEENMAKNYYGKVIHAEALFEKYLKGRNYPFTLGQEDANPLFRNILETIINKDLILTGQATPSEGMDIRRLIAFMGASTAEGINYSSLSKNIGITKYKSEKYSELLEKAFLIKRIMPEGSNVLKEPKILFTIPYRLLYKNYKECVGAIREDFFTDSMKFNGFGITYLKSSRGEKTPDYAIGKTIFEIGGASKKASQFKGFSAEKKIILSQPGKIDKLHRPLFFVGMLEQ